MRIAVSYKDGEVFQHFGHSSEFKEYIKLDRDKSTFKSHRDFSSEKEITFKHL